MLTPPETPALSSDRPITTSADDKLERGRFAAAVAERLVRPGNDSIVVGIEGEWGSGKSSLLSLVAEEIGRRRPAVAILRQDCWRLLGPHANTVVRLLHSIASALSSASGERRSLERVASALGNFADVLGATNALLPPAAQLPAGAAAGLVRKAGKALGLRAAKRAIDIEGARAEVSRALKATQIPVVVMIDELDRLEPEAIREVFRVIKTVADFDGVSYLVAYDPKAVRAALALGGELDGARYLEKIVQLQYAVPRASYRVLSRLLREAVYEALVAHKCEQGGGERFDELLDLGIGHAVRSVRDIRRLTNRLSLSLPATRGEVNAGDVVGFEVLCQRFPEIERALRSYPYLFAGGRLSLMHPFLHDLSSPGKVDIDRRAAWLLEKIVLPSHPGEDGHLAMSIVGMLFPQFTREGAEYESSATSFDRERRICNPTYLAKLLAVGPTADAPSDAEVAAFFDGSVDRKTALRELLSWPAEQVRQWLWYRALGVPPEGVRAADDLLGSLWTEFSRFAVEARGRAQEVVAGVCDLATAVFDSLQGAERSVLLKKYVADDRCLALGECVLLRYSRPHGLPAGLPPAPEKHPAVALEEIKAAIGEWLRAVESKADAGRLLEEVNLPSILFRWGQFSGSFDGPQAFVGGKVTTDEGIIEFLGAWPTQHAFDRLELLMENPRLLERAVDLRCAPRLLVDWLEQQGTQLDGAGPRHRPR